MGNARHLEEDPKLHPATNARTRIAFSSRKTCHDPVPQKLLVLGKEVSNIGKPCIRVADGRKVAPKLMLTEESDIGGPFSPATWLIDV